MNDRFEPMRDGGGAAYQDYAEGARTKGLQPRGYFDYSRTGDPRMHGAPMPAPAAPPPIQPMMGPADIAGYQGWRSQLANGTQSALNRAPAGPFRDSQLSLAQALQAQANGQGPSLAQGQLQQATDRNLSQAMALGQSLHGASAGGQLRGIQDQQAGLSQQAAQQSAMLRMQEQMQARAQLGTLLAQGRGGDQLQGAQNDEMVRFYTSQGLSLDEAQMRAKMDLLKQQQGNQLDWARLNAQTAQQQQNNTLGWFGGLSNLAMGGLNLLKGGSGGSNPPGGGGGGGGGGYGSDGAIYAGGTNSDGYSNPTMVNARQGEAVPYDTTGWSSYPGSSGSTPPTQDPGRIDDPDNR